MNEKQDRLAGPDDPQSSSDDVRVTSHESRVTSHESRAPYRLYNIGNHSPVELLDFIRAIEDAIGKKARMNFLPMQPGDVPATYADVDDLMRDVGFAPATPIRDGVACFVEWYKGYYKM